MVGEYLIALLQHWIELMGSAAFTFLSFYAAWKNKANKFVVVGTAILAAAFLLIASYQAWKVERDQVDAFSKPNFSLSIYNGGIGDIPRGVQIHLWVMMDNLGSPSSANPTSWKLTAITKDGNRYTGLPQAFGSDPREFCIGNTNKAFKYVRADSLDLKASEIIGRMGHIEGLLIFDLPNISRDILLDKQTKLSLSVSDLLKTSFSVEQSIAQLDSHSHEKSFNGMTNPFPITSETCPRYVVP